jgi:hypothetical protein
MSSTSSSKRNAIASFIVLTLLVGGGLLWFFNKPALDIEGMPPTADGRNVIDIMVLYNRAASTMYEQDAVTRINHMVDVANQVYVDSNVNITLRLVHAGMIEYEENYSSQELIEQMTDRTHPAFADLAEQRAAYGADLVVVMRPYADDGFCGLAWIGGVGTQGDFSAANEKDFGYSTVSIDCGTYVLAHELGHNMGLNHSRKQDGVGGTYDFALGHGLENDFVTIMAYASAFNATMVRRFSSPSQDCGSAPCGVDKNAPDGSDAVFTLNQVAPQIANYYGSVVVLNSWTHSKLDSDGNGLADIILRNRDGQVSYNSMRGNEILSAASVNLQTSAAWQIVGRQDYNGDGKADLLSRNELTGEWQVDLLDGDKVANSASLNMSRNLDWQVVAGGDYNGDGRGDVLVRHTDGRWYIYFIDGTKITGNRKPTLPEDTSLSLAAHGDYNGDGIDDVILRQADGGWHLYLLADGDVKSESELAMKKSLDWTAVGSADFDGDEVDDVLMRYTDGSWLIYTFKGLQTVTSGFLELTQDLSWQLQATADFDGDGAADILLRSNQFGTWQMSALAKGGIKSTTEVALTPDLNWHLPQP